MELINQAVKLKEFFEGDTRALILFDACRYDFFEEMYSEYFRGRLFKCWNGGYTFTHDWFAAHCRGNLNCTLYTPAPVGVMNWVRERTVNGAYYDPKKHFKRILSYLDIGFDYKKGSTYPKTINDAVFKYPDDKMFIRYLQPHAPYIGKPPLPWSKGPGTIIEKVKAKMASGELTIGKLKEAYKGNLRLAFEGAVELVKRLDGKFVITADHGEALGERGYLLHARSYPNLPCLCHVPWFEVEGVR